MEQTVTKIAYQDLALGALLGHGGYGEVYRGQWHGTEVAVKQLYLKTLSKPMLEDLEHEAQMMARCRFPNIVGFYGVCLEPGHYALVMEYMPKGSLYQVLQDTSIDLPWAKRFSLAIDIGKGLTFLHGQSPPILHRDIKSLNVLLDNQDCAKLSDFGLAKVKLESSSTSTQTKNKGTVRWRAPESFKRGFKPETATDIYSYGMVLWEMASRAVPYADGQDEITVMGWIKDGEQETIPKDCPPAYAEVIQKTWQSPDKRPQAQMIVKALEASKPKAPEPLQPTTYAPRAWHIDPKTKQTGKPVGQNYALIPASDQDTAKVVSFYQHHPVPGYTVASVKVIYNPVFNRGFELHLQKLQQRHNNPAFVPGWSGMSYADVRRQASEQWMKLTQPYTDPDYPNVKLLPAWHGTKPAILPSLFSAGYANLATTDNGFFGKGYYTAYEAEYSYRVYSQGALILNWVASYSALPIVHKDMQELALEGKSNYGNYDAHFVPVRPRSPGNPDENVYIPCTILAEQQYTEMVVFDSAAILPRYLVELQPELIQNPPIQKTKEPGRLEYEEGLLHLNRCQYLKSLNFFKIAAEKGYPAAYLRLRYLYQYDGLIGPKKPQESEYWYDKAKAEIDWFKVQAETGEADAQLNLGRCYNFGIGVPKDFTLAVKYFQLAADQGYAIAQNNLGWCYQKSEGVPKDLKLAVKYYQLAADQGNATAQNNLGWCYQKSEGVPKDFTLAVKYFQLAADQGYAIAQNNLGWCYQKSEGVPKDFTLAVKYFQLAADQGYAIAQNNLGWCYQKSEGVPKDFTLAVKYFQLAADQGYAIAQNNLGWCYYNGQGVPKDLTQAVKYFQLAADQGNAFAQNSLGWCYQYGEGVPKDFTLAVKYYQLAADQGYARAQHALGVCYKNGQGVPKDFTLAVKYTQLAAEQGLAQAQTNLGCCYYNGEGVLKDFKLAVKYTQLAAEQGDADAQNRLGWCYYNGEGVPKDFKLAVKYTQLAADQGYADAQFNLGCCYQNGEGVPRDLKQAVKYYQLAADQGNATAQNNLKTLLAAHPELKPKPSYSPGFFQPGTSPKPNDLESPSKNYGGFQKK